MRFRYQILLLALLPLIISVLISVGEIGQLLAQLKAGIDRDLHNSEKKIVTRLDAGLKLAADTAEVIAQSDDILLGLQTLDTEMLYQQGRLFLGSDIDYVAFVDPTGMITARGHEEFKFGDTPIKIPELLKGLSGKTTAGIVKYDQRNMLFAASPIHYYNGSIMGAVVVGIAVQSKFLQSISGLEGLRVQLWHGKKIIADSQSGKSTEGMQEISFNYPKSPDAPFTLRIMYDASERINNLTRIQNNIATYGAIISVVLFSLIFFFTNRLVNPIKTLVGAMHDYTSKGVTTFEIPRSAQEIFELVKAFREMIYDLEENKKSLVDAEKKYRTIFENAVQGIYHIDLDGNVLVSNPALARIYGMENSEELQRTKLGQQEFSYKDPEKHREFIQDIVNHGEVESREFSLIDSKGQEKLILESGHLLYNDEGDPFAIEGSVRDETRKMRQQKAEREKSIAEAASKAKSIFLDNSGQGFLSFGADLLVEGEFSKECAKILPDMCAGCEISKLLYPDPDDDKIREQFALNLQRIIRESNEFKRGLFISLMPGEFNLIRKIVKCDYKFIEDQLMMILTDITSERQLAERAKREQIKHRFIVSTVRSTRDFFDITESFGKFLRKQLRPALNRDEIKAEEMGELYREVHTFKGLMLQQDFVQTPEKLHELEDLFSSESTLKHGKEPRSIYSSCVKAFEADLDIIRESLGDRFLNNGPTINISRDTAEQLHKTAAELLADKEIRISDENRECLAELEHLDLISLTDTLENYGKLMDRLAVSMEKDLKPLKTDGNDIYFNAEKYGPFLQSLVHVFRNAVDHGIETPEERLELKKMETAAITCSITNTGESIKLVVEDNGRGIDADMIREKAASDGLMTEDEAIKMADEEVFKLLFRNMFSTREDVTNLSGRGVGLASVLAEAEALGGSVQVESELWRGTRLTFILPVSEDVRFA